MRHEFVTQPAQTCSRLAAWLLAVCLTFLPCGDATAQSPGSQPPSSPRTGLIFVSAEKSNAVFVLDPKTLAVKHTIKTSKRPRDMHFSADRKRLYVACGDADVVDVIDVIDVAKLAVVSRIKTGKSPELFAIDETRRRL